MTPDSTKTRLLDAAARVFLTHGFAAASMDMVRQEAGVSNGSLYHHFPTKAQLADALYAYTLRGFHAAQMEAVQGRASAQAGVKGLVRSYIDWVVAHPNRARLLHELKRGDLGGATAEWDRANREGFEVLREWIDRQVAAAQMRPLPFPVWMAVVFSPAIALTPHWIAQDPPGVPARVRTALEHAAWMAVAP